MKNKSILALGLAALILVGFASSAVSADQITSKWDLWVNGPHLRGANIYQRHIYPEIDGSNFMGPGLFGPPYSQADLNRLADWGANYVNISHPGLFEEEPPYALDINAQDNLDELLGMIAEADMFAVISFRTGPGRSEFTFFFGEDGDWFDKRYYNDEVWRSPEAQTAWEAMWAYTAARYRDNPIVVGYDLMVEPNSNDVWLDEWEPEIFYAEYGETLYDWNPLAARISEAIREVDESTPILIGGMSYSAIDWLPYVQPTGDEHTVYAVHQYAPHDYTHQWDETDFPYPGEMDLDWDGETDRFDNEWLGDEIIALMDDFSKKHNAPIAVNEFGVIRWVPGAAQFIGDQMAYFEQSGINYAIWEWESSWEPIQSEIDAFNFRLGPDPENYTEVENSPYIDVLKTFWEQNIFRPSNTPFVPDM